METNQARNKWIKWLREWLECPFCLKLRLPINHHCAAFRGMTDTQRVAIVTRKVRDILADAPADKLVHSALSVMDELDKKFEVTR